MDNLKIYNAVKNVPDNAKKTIGGGKLRGMTDINPMWRIKVLTEQFGACGIGWYYEVINQWSAEDANETAVFVNINLYIKVDDEWSKPIFGTGGSKMVSLEKGSPVLSDECYKMATTDAISVACKQLGIGADVYWDKDKTKYSTVEDAKEQPKVEQPKTEQPQMTQEEVLKRYASKISPKDASDLASELVKRGISIEFVCQKYNVTSISEMTYKKFDNVQTHYDDILKMQNA